ncbi:ArsR/SmtB family transcription factor [Novosphingobium sp.]|uniref:ArsR/SmtB family transcription factor n=1 Tax=Novosphingobium sp. TaxID=1874826 RepID=UPI003FA6049E
MGNTDPVRTLAALAHGTRFDVYKLLSSAGDEGLAAGEIASRLQVAPTALSNHLGILTRAGVITQERQGRSLIYRAQLDHVRDLARQLSA